MLLPILARRRVERQSVGVASCAIPLSPFCSFLSPLIDGYRKHCSSYRQLQGPSPAALLQAHNRVPGISSSLSSSRSSRKVSTSTPPSAAPLQTPSPPKRTSPQCRPRLEGEGQPTYLKERRSPLLSGKRQRQNRNQPAAQKYPTTVSRRSHPPSRRYPKVGGGGRKKRPRRVPGCGRGS